MDTDSLLNIGSLSALGAGTGGFLGHSIGTTQRDDRLASIANELSSVSDKTKSLSSDADRMTNMRSKLRRALSEELSKSKLFGRPVKLPEGMSQVESMLRSRLRATDGISNYMEQMVYGGSASDKELYLAAQREKAKRRGQLKEVLRQKNEFLNKNRVPNRSKAITSKLDNLKSLENDLRAAVQKLKAQRGYERISQQNADKSRTLAQQIPRRLGGRGAILGGLAGLGLGAATNL